MVGYAEPMTLAGRLLAGAREVYIFNVEHEVHAAIGSMSSMSAHGDYEDLCQFVSHQNTAQVKKLFLVHGEYNVQLQFRQRLLNKGFHDVEIPEQHKVFDLK